jgi:hypothetical protein
MSHSSERRPEDRLEASSFGFHPLDRLVIEIRLRQRLADGTTQELFRSIRDRSDHGVRFGNLRGSDLRDGCSRRLWKELTLDRRGIFNRRPTFEHGGQDLGPMLAQRTTRRSRREYQAFI